MDMAIGLKPIKATNSSLPSQAQQYLRGLINDGTYQPGQKLPPEGEIAQQLGISRPTLREALHNLEMDGIILRKHGVGTFVSPAFNKRIESGLEVLESIERIAKRIGLETKMGAVEIQERTPLPRQLAGLERDAQDAVLSVTRTILIDAQPVAYLQDCVPLEYLCKDDLGTDFHGSVLDIFIQRGDPVLSYSFTKLAAVPATKLLSSQLMISHRTPLMQLEAKLYTVENHVVDYSVSHFVSDYFYFHVIRRIGK
jgi:GntR family transcriptional regulator